MKLVPYDIEKIGEYKLCCNQEIVYEFAQSDLKCAKVENLHTKNAYITQRALQNACKKMHLDNIIVVSRKGEVFLVKKN